MTPKPQAKTIDEILNELQARDFYDAVRAIEKLGASVDFTKSVGAVGELGRQYGYRVTERDQTETSIEALIKKARANERQAMLDALPKKYSREAMAKASQHGFRAMLVFNDAIDRMESAIKLRGGDDE